MSHFVYEEPSAEELTIKDPIDRIADITHSCYQVKAKTHSENRIFVKDLCTSFHMSMLEHGFFHLRFWKKDFLELMKDSENAYPLVWSHAKFMNFAYDGESVYLTLSLRTLTEAIDSLYKGGLLENTERWKEDSKEDRIHVDEGISYKMLISHLIDHLPPDAKAIVLAHFKKEDDVQGFMEKALDALPKSKKRKLFIFLNEGDIQNLSESVRDSQQILTYRLKTDRGVTHELVRHRQCAFAQESTRFCDYSKKKFGYVLHILRPLDYEKHPEAYDLAFEHAAVSYFALLKENAKPEEARAILPNALKAELTITASLKEWKFILSQRLAPDAHPEAQRIMRLVQDDMIKKSYLKCD